MLLHNSPFISLRALLTPFALALPLALSLAACDGVDDQDAPNDEELVADDEAEDDAEGQFMVPALDIADDVTPSAACSSYVNIAGTVLLKDPFGTTYGNVQLHTGAAGCREAFAKTTVTDVYVADYSRRVVTKLQWRSTLGGAWIDSASNDSGWTSSASVQSVQSTPVLFPASQQVRACGFIEGGILGETTTLRCTPGINL